MWSDYFISDAFVIFDIKIILASQSKKMFSLFPFFSNLKNILEVLNYLYLEYFIELSIKNSFPMSQTIVTYFQNA